MPFDPTPHLDPSQCAVLVFECQQMVLGDDVPYPGLADSVRASGMLTTLAGLLDAARSAGAPVVYCTMSARADGLGTSKTPMLDRSRATGAPPADVDRSIMPQVAPCDGDVIIDRTHGMSAFYGTELDLCLKDLGIRTLIPTGVSANIGVVGTAIEAVNHGYRLVVAPECIGSDPPEYGEQMMRFTFRNLAYMTTVGAITEIWAG